MSIKGIVKEDFTKVGVIIAYISSKLNTVTVTKLLKLLYIIDEESIKKRGFSITKENYNVYFRGPVSEKVYWGIRNNNIDLLSFFNIEIRSKYETGLDNDITIITPKNTSVDYSVLSNYEMKLIDNILDKYQDTSASELISILHSEGSLWSKEMIKHNIKFETRKTSKYKIQFEELVKDIPILLSAYKSSVENATV